MGDPLREAWSELSAAIDHSQAHHPVRFALAAWAFTFAAAFVSLWLAGEPNLLYAAMAATGVVGGLALGARVRSDRDA